MTERKNFLVRFRNDRITPGYFETGENYASSKELIEWFNERFCDANWNKITDIEIIEEKGHALRLDLMIEIIRPRIKIFSPGKILKPVFFEPLPSRSRSPKLVLETEYLLKSITLDKEGYQHLNVGIVSDLNWITSYETGEVLPEEDKIYWCHPIRFIESGDESTSKQFFQGGKIYNWEERQGETIKHLNNLSNKRIEIPIISLKKSFSWDQLSVEVAELSEVGKVFIIEMTEIESSIK